jgi:hypothetical protein
MSDAYMHIPHPNVNAKICSQSDILGLSRNEDNL